MSAKWPNAIPRRFQPPYSVASAVVSAASDDRTTAFIRASVSRMPPLAIVFGPREVPLGENGCWANDTRSRPSGPVYFVWAWTDPTDRAIRRRTKRMTRDPGVNRALSAPSDLIRITVYRQTAKLLQRGVEGNQGVQQPGNWARCPRGFCLLSEGGW